MRRFPMRFRVRTVMLAVAAVGLVLGALSCAARLRARSERFRAIAIDHYFAELGPPGSDRGELDLEPLRAYHGQLRRKYLHAAQYPWLSVAADPLPPVLVPRQRDPSAGVTRSPFDLDADSPDTLAEPPQPR